jgi:hypothetical protein
MAESFTLLAAPKTSRTAGGLQRFAPLGPGAARERPWQPSDGSQGDAASYENSAR